MIKDGKHYGIFSDEANNVIDLVKDHAPLQSIEAHACPKCGAAFRVGYYPNGTGFVITCIGPTPHMTQYQVLASPPSWWKERVIEVTPYLTS